MIDVYPVTTPSICVLTYHSVGPTRTADFRPWTVSPGLFAEQLAALKAAGWQLHTFAEAAQLLSTGTVSGEDRIAAVTIDDGFRDCEEYALPLMIAAGLTATLFVPTAYVGARAGWLPGQDGNRLQMHWRALEDAAAAGFEVSSHGHRHLPLDVLKGRDLLDEVVLSRRLLQDKLNAPAATFAYPFGYHSAPSRRLIREAGYRYACVVSHLHSRAADLPSTLPRLLVGPDLSAEALLKSMEQQARIHRRVSVAARQRLWFWARRYGGFRTRWDPAQEVVRHGAWSQLGEGRAERVIDDGEATV